MDQQEPFVLFHWVKSKDFSLPINIWIKTYLLSPGKIEHAPLNSFSICFIIMPNLPIKKGWGGGGGGRGWRHFAIYLK